jgi:hypothetical protein
MDGSAMTDKTGGRHNELLEGCIAQPSYRANRSSMPGDLSALQSNCEIPAIRSRSTTGRNDALSHSSRHLHGEVLIGVRLLSDAVVRNLDLSAGVDATGEGLGLGGAG